MDLRQIKIYTAGPYRGDIDTNIQAAKTHAVRLWEAGFTCVCPHLNTQNFERVCTVDESAYIEGDLALLDCCEGVLMLPGWENSEGARLEQSHAISRKMPLFFNIQDVIDYPWMDQYIAFREITNGMYHTHVHKNRDYSAANILGYGEDGVITRIWDKACRLMNLAGYRVDVRGYEKISSGVDPENESLVDSFMDNAVYSVIGLLARAGRWGK